MAQGAVAETPTGEAAAGSVLSSHKGAPSKSGHFIVLDAARGYAAVCVVIYHIMELFRVPGSFSGAFLAVDLFFLMSGFVIAFSYDQRLRDRSMSFWRFFEVRTIRLYPLYAVSILLGALYFCVKIALGQPDAPAASDMLIAVGPSVLMLPVVAVGDPALMNYPFSPSAWSLVLEFWFNLVFAITAVRWGVRALGVIAAVAFVVLCVQSVGYTSTDLGWGVSTLLGGSARFWFSFTVGVVLFRLRKAGPALKPVHLLLVSPALLFILIPRDNIVLQLIWIGVAFPLFVHVAARVNVSGALATISDHLGRLSYGIYILHGPVMMLMLGMLTVMMGRSWELYPVQTGVFLLAGVMVATAAATYFFDEPFRRWLRAWRRPAKA